MAFVSTFIVIFITSFLVPIISQKITKTSNKNVPYSKTFCVYYPKYLIIFFSAFLLSCLIVLILLNIFSKISLFINIITLALVIFMLVGLIYLSIFRILVDNEKLVIKSPFKKAKIIYMKDISKVKVVISSRGELSNQVYTNKKVLVISTQYRNSKDLINVLKEKSIKFEYKYI